MGGGSWSTFSTWATGYITWSTVTIWAVSSGSWGIRSVKKSLVLENQIAGD